MGNLLRLLTFGFVCLADLGKADELRIAVVSPPDRRSEADLLSVYLSKTPGVTLVERDEVEKLIAEKELKLTGLTAADAERIGRVLRAQSVLLLEAGKDQLHLRFLSVQSGAIWRWTTCAWPVQEPQSWAELEATVITSLARKAVLPASEILPVSLLRINSATGERNNSVETTLNQLLATQLANTAGVVLLERSRLETLGTEHDPESDFFWKSAWIVDGNFTLTSEGCTLNLRLQPPSTSNAVQIQTKGTGLSSIVSQAAEKVRGQLERSSLPWKVEDEIRRLALESKWAAGTGLWQQAAQACEAAVVLGDTSEETHDLRWKSYRRWSRQQVQSEEMVSGLTTFERCLETYRDSMTRDLLSKPKVVRKVGRWNVAPVQPGGEGSVLLNEISQEVHSWITARKLSEADQLLAPLRRQMRLLYDAIVERTPELQLKNADADKVPLWSYRADDPSQPREWKDLETKPSIRTERLRMHIVWGDEAAQFLPFLRSSLLGEQSSDPGFYQTFLTTLCQASLEGWTSSEKRNAWRAIGVALLAVQACGSASPAHFSFAGPVSRARLSQF